jgi:hypothetical protein
MGGAGSELLRLSLQCDRLAPARAREAVKHLQTIGSVRDDAVLLVSELVSSTVLARESGPSETIELIASEVPHGLCLAVATEAGAPRPRPEALSAWVIGALARRWGVESEGGRARVWAELAL